MKYQVARIEYPGEPGFLKVVPGFLAETRIPILGERPSPILSISGDFWVEFKNLK